MAGNRASSANVSDWNNLKIVLSVARTGSYFAAGRELKLHQTTLSRRVQQLEAELDATLFVRHAHGVKPTAAGQALIEKAADMEQSANQLRSGLAGYDARLSGLLRLQVTEGVGTYWLVPAMAEFTERYPDIRIELQAGIQPADLLAGEADICLTIQRPNDPRIVGRRVATLSYGLFASRHYLRMNSTPTALTALASHRLVDLELHRTDPQLGWWQDIVEAQGGAAFNSRSVGLVIAAIQEGQGIGLLPSFYSQVPLDLVRLPITIASETELWLLTHEATNQSLKVKTMSRYLHNRFDRDGRRWLI